MDSDFLYSDIFYSAGFLADLTVIAFACRARCWLLVTGMLLRVPVDGQVFIAKFYRIIGHSLDAPSATQVLINRTLSCLALAVITFAMIQLLLRYARFERTLAPRQ